jgi:hypothetical protein
MKLLRRKKRHFIAQPSDGRLAIVGRDCAGIGDDADVIEKRLLGQVPGLQARGDSGIVILMAKFLVVAACLVLAACEAAVDINATSNVPARYSSVLVTVKAVWFNESASAVPADATWEKFPLDDTRTIDLVDLTGGQLASIAEGLLVPTGTYRQVRVILASRDEDLHDSADDLDATYNNQVTWFDDDGEELISPLEVLNADQGIGIATRLKVVVATGGTRTSTLQIAFDAARDLTEFRYGGRTGFLLNPTLTAFDVDDAGTIRGTLNLSQLDIDTESGRPEIQVTAQKLDETLNRRVIVASTSPAATGSFVLYPLPFDEDDSTNEFDLVISGPAIRTVVIRDVPVSEGAAGSGAQLALGGVVLEPADSFEANISEDAPALPRGARIGFFQTLPGEDEPYVIEVAAVDPLRGRLAQPVRLARASSISHGTYSSGGFTLSSGTPEEGAARYAVAALSPHYGGGAFAATTLRPASLVSDTAFFTVPVIDVPAPAVPGTITATVTVENPGQHDSGMLLATHDGAVVTAVPLDDVLQQLLGSTFVDVAPVPAGTAAAAHASGLYYLEAWTWDSTDPGDTFSRHPGTEADLRALDAATGTVTIR